jgi:hypothetical protein
MITGSHYMEEIATGVMVGERDGEDHDEVKLFVPATRG